MSEPKHCPICNRRVGINDGDNGGPPVDLGRCAASGGFECRAVAQAVAGYRREDDVRLLVRLLELVDAYEHREADIAAAVAAEREACAKLSEDFAANSSSTWWCDDIANAIRARGADAKGGVR